MPNAGDSGEVAEFLKEHPPFDAADADEIEAIAAAAEVEFHPSGATIFSERAGPVGHLRVIRKGAVEIRHDGRVLDLLGPGELFGHASMLVRAAHRVRGGRRRGHALLPHPGGRRPPTAGPAGRPAVHHPLAAGRPRPVRPRTGGEPGSTAGQRAAPAEVGDRARRRSRSAKRRSG